MDLAARRNHPAKCHTESGFGDFGHRPKIFEDTCNGGFVLPKRRVHCVQPITKNDTSQLKETQEFAKSNQVVINQERKTISSLPMNIPGSHGSQKEPLIKAFPAVKEPFSRRSGLNHTKFTSAHPLSPPTGSWTNRQMNFSPGNETLAKTDILQKAGNGVIRGSKPLKPKERNKDEMTVEHAAWRFRFKKKWIREELNARRQDFPDDSDYEDLWEDAGEFIVKNGYKSALQAAFIGGSREDLTSEESNIDSDDSTFEDLSFGNPDEDDLDKNGKKPDSEAKMLSHAATLVHLTHKLIGVN